MDFTGAAGRRDLGEADQGMHQSQLPWIVELEAGDALAGRGASRLSEMLELSAIDQCLKDVLLGVESGSPIKDQVVAEFDLREEQPVLTARLPALCFTEERGEARQPFATAARQILCGRGVGEFLEPLGGAAPQEGVPALREVDALLAHTVGEPVMLVETDPSGERQIGHIRTNIRP